MRSQRGTRNIPLYTLEGRGVSKEVRGHNFLPLNKGKVVTHGRMLNGPRASTELDVPTSAVNKVSPKMLSRQDILVRVIAYAVEDGRCHLCGKIRIPGTLAHEAKCPIPDAMEMVARRPQKPPRLAADDADDDDDVDDEDEDEDEDEYDDVP